MLRGRYQPIVQMRNPKLGLSYPGPRPWAESEALGVRTRPASESVKTEAERQTISRTTLGEKLRKGSRKARAALGKEEGDQEKNRGQTTESHGDGSHKGVTLGTTSPG